MKKRYWAASFGALLAMGCQGERVTAPAPLTPELTLGTVTVSPENAIMAVGATLLLNITGQTLSGAPIASFDSIWYYLENQNDSLKVRVSPSGLVTALASTAANNPVRVTVLPFKGGLVKADQMLIQVTDSAIQGLTLSIQPLSPDSAKLAKGSSKTITPLVRNPNTGQSVASPRLRLVVKRADFMKLQGYCVSTSFSTATITAKQIDQMDGDCPAAPNSIRAMSHAGSVWVFAAVDAYGTLLRDSVQYTLSPPYSISYSIGTVGLTLFGGGNETAYLSPTGDWSVFNSIPIGLPITVTFDDPSAATEVSPPSTEGGSSGDVTALSPWQSSQRRFNNPGTYKWTATVGGNIPPYSGQTTSGTIVVRP